MFKYSTRRFAFQGSGSDDPGLVRGLVKLFRGTDRTQAGKPSTDAKLSGAPSNVFDRSRKRQNELFRQRGGGAAGGSKLEDRIQTPGGAVHMYANKENAWKDYTDDRYYGARRFKEYWQRMFKDRGVRYYIFGVLFILMAATAKLWQIQQQQQEEEGLLGPRDKKKRFRSRLTVVLDVDETIVSYGDKAFRMKAGMVARPYLAELLDYLVSIDAEVVLWSACSDRYMSQVLSVIDPAGVRISQYITRNSLWFTNDNYYEKNALWLKRPMENTLVIENRALSVRNCNANAILVDDFIRGEYMDTGQDYPSGDHALRTIRDIIADLEKSGMPVNEYLADRQHRNPDIKEIPCHLAIRQLPEEIARGVFYFVGDKYTSFGGRKTAPVKSSSSLFTNANASRNSVFFDKKKTN